MTSEADGAAPGISQSLAESRASRVRDLRCALGLSIPPDRARPVRGRVRLTFGLTTSTEPLLLDFAPGPPGSLVEARVNGAPTRLEQRHGHIVIPPERLRNDDNDVDLLFESGDGPLNRREDMAYTLFVPARAHEAMPCFDQPGIRARWSVTVEIPEAWTVVSNGPETSRTAFVDDRGDHRALVSFGETEPIPTYLLAVAAGRFTEERLTCGERPMRVLHRETDAARLGASLAPIARLHEEALAWLEGYTGVAYPFATLDVVLVPAFQFNGMEHPGAIYYDAGALLLDASATPQQRLARAHLIAHETTHMWFGNLVTMRWFSDVWMKEVFANFLAARIVALLHPDTDPELAFFHAHYAAAYDVDRTRGANPIRQPLDNLLDAGSLYGPIVYLKSPIVLRQLERIVGPDALRDALRAFLQRFRFGSASWPDLLALLQPIAPLDVASWSHDWIAEPGRPTVQCELAVSAGRIASLTLTTSDPHPGRACRWPQQLDVALGYGPRVEHVPVYLDGQCEVRAAHGRAVPDFVLPDGAGLGYGAFRLDPGSLAWLRANLPLVGDPLTRASAWITLWDAMLDGQLPAADLVDLSLATLASETSDLTTTRILGCLEKTFWIFLSPDERSRCAPQVEQVLRDGIDAAPVAPLKAAFLSALRAVATRMETLEWFEALWRRDASIPGLPLGEADRIALVQELALRDLPYANALVDEQIHETADPDRREALVFLEPALSSHAGDRARFWRSLETPANRRREPWVVAGLRALHHPLRQASALPYIEPGLAMLDAVRRTGDIFFPRRWADAILAGHGSREAAGLVRGFLDSRPPSYSPALRRIVLVAGDLLMRAAERTRGT